MDKTKLKKIIKQIRGVSYKPEDLHNELDEDSVILLRANNIDSGKINFDDVIYIDKSKVSEEQYLRPGDILICASSGSKNLVGKAASVTFVKNCTFGAFCKVVRPNEGLADYMGAFFQSPIYRRKISEVAIGANINNIRNEHIDGLDIPIFSKAKKDEIVKNIQLIQDIIEKRKDELMGLDELVKARFVEMFGNPVSNLKSWKTQKMEEIAPIVNFKGNFDNKVWILNLDMVESQTGRIIDYLIVAQEEIGNSVITFDMTNVLYSKLRPYLNKVVIPNRCGYATSELIPLQPVKTKINREYLAFMLRNGEFVNMISKRVVGAKMPRVSMKEFRRFDVPVPPIAIQNQFTDFVHQVDKSKVASYNQLKNIAILLAICSIIYTNLNGNMGRIPYDN